MPASFFDMSLSYSSPPPIGLAHSLLSRDRLLVHTVPNRKHPKDSVTPRKTSVSYNLPDAKGQEAGERGMRVEGLVRAKPESLGFWNCHLQYVQHSCLLCPEKGSGKRVL